MSDIVCLEDKGLTDKKSHEPIDLKFIQAFVLLQRQYLLIENFISTNSIFLERLEESVLNKTQSINDTLNVYNYIFGLIDHIERYRKIAFTVPKFNYKGIEYRRLKAALDSLSAIRDQFQHINNDIDNQFSGPLLGAVYWVSNQRQFVASFNDLGRERSSPGIILDTQKGEFLHNFCYVYNQKYYDLEKAIANICEFNKFIKEAVQLEVGGKPYVLENDFVAACIEFKGLKISDKK